MHIKGLQDTNLARVRATQDYLVKCDNILVVGKISRAITDQSLNSSIYEILHRHVPLEVEVEVEVEDSPEHKLNIAVVCTMSEVCEGATII